MKLVLCHPSAHFSTADVARGIAAGLRAEGHEVVDYQLANRLMAYDAWLRAMCPPGQQPDPEEIALYGSEGLVYRAVSTNSPWVLAVNGCGLHPNAVAACRNVGIRIAVWFTEAPYESTEERELYLARLCDLALVNERTAVPMFQTVLDKLPWPARAVYLPHAYDPARHRPDGPVCDESERADVLFIGTGFPERRRLLESVDWTGIDLRLGGLWPGLVEPYYLADRLTWECMANADTLRLYRGAKIVLNPHRYHATAESANPRTFEAAAVGAFQITDYRQEVADLFGDSVPTYDPGVPWQLEALVRRYLADDGERARLAAAAQRRVQGQTFEARARTIVETMAEVERDRRPRLVAKSA